VPLRLYFLPPKGYDDAMTATMPTYDDIHRMLIAHLPIPFPADFRTRAAVALILRTAPLGLEVLFIERAMHAGDPWSGDLGFPGGKVEASDREARLTAERETREEIDLDLRSGRYLGRLSDIAGAHLPVTVSCFVYGLTEPTPFRLGDEVRTTFWTPLEQLCNPERHIEAAVRFGGATLVRPAIRLLEPGQTVLWGITYRLVIQFLGILGCPLTRDG
jgi:8-oxo-dGTP pyrophosphatase MutT (NUDIX family)